MPNPDYSSLLANGLRNDALSPPAFFIPIALLFAAGCTLKVPDNVFLSDAGLPDENAIHDLEAPPAPTNLRASSTETTVLLQWDAPEGTIQGYRIYDGATLLAVNVAQNSSSISGLTKCHSYTFTVKAFNIAGESADGASATSATTGCDSNSNPDPSEPGQPGPTSKPKAAPYLYLGWGDPPNPVTIMNITGIRYFTMAFVLAANGCDPQWDGYRPLAGSVDAQQIAAIKAAGGDVIPSFGGWAGNKLGIACANAQALAGAYQKVIDAYQSTAIDIDIEATEFENESVQDRVLSALKIVKQNNPGIKIIVTFNTAASAPTSWGSRLIRQAAALQVDIDVFTIMPFNFEAWDLYQFTVNASEGLKSALMSAFGWSAEIAYQHMGISGMNGISDQQELCDTGIWTRIRDWASSNHLGHLAFWAVNRDRGCPGGASQVACSGIAQDDWAFTRIAAGFSP